MKDTPFDIIQKQREIFAKKTPQERFIIGIETINMGRAIVESSIKQNNKDISEIELKILVFKRYYANIFSQSELENIINSMRIYYSNKIVNDGNLVV